MRFSCAQALRENQIGKGLHHLSVKAYSIFPPQRRFQTSNVSALTKNRFIQREYMQDA